MTSTRAPLVRRSDGDPDAPSALVLLHGLTDSGACWADVVPHWVGAGRRVVTVDARGHGRSPRWTAAELDGSPGDVMADDVLHVLDALGAQDVVLVGHSMGAAVAVAVAASGDARAACLRGVVAEDPPWPVPPRSGRDPLVAKSFVTGWDDDALLDVDALAARIRRDNPGWPEAEILPCAVATHQCQRDLLVTGDIVPRTPWPDLVTALTASGPPLLVVTGDHDVRVDADSERVARASGAGVTRVPGAGHCVRRDNGPGYLAAVDGFLAELAR